MSAVFILFLAMACFLLISAYKAWQFARMPLHGRMDLYPIPKEKGHEHGGSYYEEVEWWNKPRHVSHMTELIDMLKEIIFIKKLFQNQRKFWWFSYALHLGIYFLFAWTFLLLIGSLTEFAGVAVTPDGSWWPFLIDHLTAICGYLGFILATFGAVTLIIRRLSDDVLKKYTTPQEYFNLLLLLAALVTGIAAWGGDFRFAAAGNFAKDALSGSVTSLSPIVAVHLLILSLMFIYIPLSKMSHYVGKFFTYHAVIWENDPNLPGSEVEAKVKAALAYKAQNTWSAPHIKPPTTPPLGN